MPTMPVSYGVQSIAAEFSDVYCSPNADPIHYGITFIPE